MPNIYDPGDEIRLTATFTDANGDAVDPTAVVIIVRKPDGSKLSYTSPTGFNSQGNWDANANSPALADGMGTAGDYYTVNVAGTQTFDDEEIVFVVGDQIYYNGNTWRRLKSVQSTNLTKSATGIYYIDQYISALPGAWHYGSDGAGVAIAAGENWFRVREQQV